MNITLVFRKSRSPQFGAAMDLAEMLGVKDTGKRAPRYVVNADESTFPVLYELLAIVAGWKGTVLTVDSQIVPEHAFRWMVVCLGRQGTICRERYQGSVACRFCPASQRTILQRTEQDLEGG